MTRDEEVCYDNGHADGYALGKAERVTQLEKERAELRAFIDAAWDCTTVDETVDFLINNEPGCWPREATP